jgi:DNA polymerase-1
MEKEYTEKGALKTDADTLAKFSDKNIFCKLISDYKAFHKQLELFESIKNQTRNGKCYPLYNFYRTATGRLSSCKPAIQIIPDNKHVKSPTDIVDYRPLWPNNSTKDGVILETSPNFKEIFCPDPGCELLYADYHQLEIVILANYIQLVSNDCTLQNSIKEGKDTHSYTASLLYSTITGTTYSYEFIRDNKKLEPYKTWRQDSKSVIFKLIYGGTYKSLAKEKGISEIEAKKIFDTFLDLIPGIREYMQHQWTNAAINKFVETYAGHQRELRVLGFERRNGKANNISLNHPIQGTASYVVNIGLMKYHEELKKLDPQNGRVLLTVHDSIASQVAQDKVEEALKLKKWCMEEYVKIQMPEFLKVPVSIELKHGKNWHQIV